MKKNLKYLIIGGTAVASVVIVAAPIAATSKYTYPSDPLKEVSEDLSQITNAAFAQGTFDYNTKYADLKSEVLSKKQKDGSWNVDGFIDFFKGQENSYDKVSFPNAEIKVSDIKPNDEQKSFDVFFYVQSTKKNDRGDIVSSSVAKATISFGYKPKLELAAFAHDVARESFTGKITSGQNPNVTSLLRAYTLNDITADAPADRAILELTPVQDFVADVNNATSSEAAVTELGKYFDISSILNKINDDSKNKINATTTPASSTTEQSGVKATQDATTTTSESRYKVSLIKDPNNDTKYITLVNGGKSAKIFLQTEFSDAFKAKYQGLEGIDAKHIDILEIPLTGFADSLTLESQFAAPTLQVSDYYVTPATPAAPAGSAASSTGNTAGNSTSEGTTSTSGGTTSTGHETPSTSAHTAPSTGGQTSSSTDSHTTTTAQTTTTADTSTTSNSEIVKIDLKKQDPLNWIFAYNSFFFPSKEYKDAYAKNFINASLNEPFGIKNFAFAGDSESGVNKDAIDKKIDELKSDVKFDGSSLGLEYKDGKVVATISGSITVSSARGTLLFTKPFDLTLDHFPTPGRSELNQLLSSSEQQNIFFPKDQKFGNGALSYNLISNALKSSADFEAAKNVLADPTTTNVRFYTGERLETLTSKFTLPTTAQIASDFSLDTSSEDKTNGYFNIKSKFLTTSLSALRYYYTLANQGLDVAASQLLDILKAANLVDKTSKIEKDKPIFNQLQSIKIKNVDSNTHTGMKFFVINNENQRNNANFLQSGLVNLGITKDIIGKIADTKGNDYQILNDIMKLKPKEIIDSRLDPAKFESFENLAQLLVAMYTKVYLFATPGIGFPLLPIGKGVELKYNIEVSSSDSNKEVQKGQVNNFTYQYNLGFDSDTSSTLFSGTKDAETLKNISVNNDTSLQSGVEKLNLIVKNISTIYNSVSVDKTTYDTLNTNLNDNASIVAELRKIGLGSLVDYLTSVAPGFALEKSTDFNAAITSQATPYKTLSFTLSQSGNASTQPIRIFVYEKKQSSNTGVVQTENADTRQQKATQ